MKPHLKRLNGYWTHSGQGVTGYGVTADGAYRQWLAMLRLQDQRFYDPQQAEWDAPAETAREMTDPMLLALAAWEPETAH